MEKQKAVNKKGFTLMELLIVVVIIGLLSSIAIPMYKKAVEKSRASEALTTMSAVTKSEHDWYLVKNNYTTDFANLDIDLSGTMENGKLKTTFYNYELLETGVFAQRANGEYSLYRDYDTSQIMCTPSTHYICDGLGVSFPKAACEKTGMAWANRNSTCYATNEARCKDLHGDSMWHENGDNSYCGYTNVNNSNIGEGMICRATSVNGCDQSTVKDGGVCYATAVNGCPYATVRDGGVCYGDSTSSSCMYATVLDGGICKANDADACGGADVSGTGKCIVDEEYHDINTSGGCLQTVIHDGGRCIGEAGFNACRHAHVRNGGICEGTGLNACRQAHIEDGGICISSPNNACRTDAEYTGTGCCCGNYCGTKPKCDSSRCVGL